MPIQIASELGRLVGAPPALGLLAAFISALLAFATGKPPPAGAWRVLGVSTYKLHTGCELHKLQATAVQALAS